METTPCGLLKFSEIDSYNYSDAKTNFERPDELLARMGAHESRFFNYNGVAALTAIGGTMTANWDLKGFLVRGEGEWFYVSVTAEAKVNINKKVGNRILNLPAFFSAMHTQVLSSQTNGRGTRGWISSAGAVHLGTSSGSDEDIPKGEWVQLSGWYLPKNELTTVGIPSVGEKSPFFSGYINYLNVVDKACSRIQTNMPVDAGAKTLTISSSGNYANMGSENIFAVKSADFSISQARAGLYGNFGFFAAILKSKKNFNVLVSGKINHKTFGTIVSERFKSRGSQPMGGDHTGRITYAHINESSELIVTAVGRSATTGDQTITVGEELAVAGYYRLLGT